MGICQHSRLGPCTVGSLCSQRSPARTAWGSSVWREISELRSVPCRPWPWPRRAPWECPAGGAPGVGWGGPDCWRLQISVSSRGLWPDRQSSQLKYKSLHSVPQHSQTDCCSWRAFLPPEHGLCSDREISESHLHRQLLHLDGADAGERSNLGQNPKPRDDQDELSLNTKHTSQDSLNLRTTWISFLKKIIILSLLIDNSIFNNNSLLNFCELLHGALIVLLKESLLILSEIRVQLCKCSQNLKFLLCKNGLLHLANNEVPEHKIH